MIRCRVCGSELPDGAIFCGECGSAVSGNAVPRAQLADPRPGDTTIYGGLPLRGTDGVPSDDAPLLVERSVRSTLPTADLSEQVPTWVLAFSTGERVVVGGSGLLGRRPVSNEGERHDQHIGIHDPGRSVSKTHLEFGVDDGRLWVLDRYSANGTAIVAPDGTRRVCEPGTRYRVERGSRIEIGEQHLLIG